MKNLKVSWVTLGDGRGKFCYLGQLVDADLNQVWRCHHVHHRCRLDAEWCAHQKLKELRGEDCNGSD